MATYTGQDGALTIGGDAVAELRSCSMDLTINTTENTVMKDDTRRYKPGIQEWSGSADIYYSTAVVQNINDSITAGQVAFIGYPSTDAAGDPKVSGNIIITGISINSTMEGMVESSISFQGTGDVVIGTAT